MMRAMRSSFVLIAALFVGLPVHAEAPKPAADAKLLVEKIQKFYDATRDLHAHFDQTLESGIGRAKKASGEVWLKKPGKMRWDYDKPEKKLLVADGTTLWVYEEEDQQAFRQPMTSSTLPAQVSFLVGEGRLAQEFDATVVEPPGIGGPGEVVVKLVPKASSGNYRYLLFVTDSATGQVKETVIYDQQGGTNRLRFSGLAVNTKVEDAKFKFTPPAGVKILQAPSQK